MTTRNATGNRTCGWTEEHLFLWFDGDLPADERLRFERHLPGCAGCEHDREAYANLFARLAALPAPVVGPAFDHGIMRGALRPAPVRFADPGNAWLRGMLLAAAAAVVLVLGTLLLVDEQAVVNKAARPVAHLGARAAVDAVVQLMNTISLSQVVIDLVHALEPVGRTLGVIARAFQSEILLVSLLMSVVALLGAVRLADGTSAVERGVRRVCLALQI
ncbi:MAG TPA: zf-HC2 domain-containing protein [Candidatus Eisenbacteria bacterium]